MRNRSSTRDPRGMGARSANERWKDRWRTLLLASTLGGAAAHGVLFTVWPAWRFALAEPREATELMQIRPISSTGVFSVPAEGPSGAGPRTEPVPLALDGEGGSGEEVDIGELFEVFGVPEPRMSYPILPQDIGARTTARTAALVLSEIEPIGPQLVVGAPAVSWPLIRNPTVLQRFLRRAYNPVAGADKGTGLVSVAMWIDERGYVGWAEVRESSGNPVLDEIALAVFNQVAVFAPARSQGQAVAMAVVISVPFNTLW